MWRAKAVAPKRLRAKADLFNRACELRLGRPILPLSVEVRTPVSETGRAGALPAAAANFICDLRFAIADYKNNKEQTPRRET
jgi:hypothetical protein